MFNNEIKLFLLETDFLFSKLREYLEIVDKSLNFEENRVWQYSDETLRKSFYWESKKFAFEYFWPLAKHYSFITLLHLMMEERLRQLCEIVRANDEQLNEYTLGNGIEDYMGFLEKGKRYVMKRVEISEWQNITDFEKIRNCIVHAYGRI